MRTIAVINQKGGCGKTTVAVNLAAVLAAQGRRTLLVDVDPQSHCALGLAVPEAQVERHVGDVLRAGLDGSIGIGEITWEISRFLDLAPATMALAGIEQELAGAPDRDRRLLQVLSPVYDRYEFCIIDCPPAIGLLTFNALRAADEVIVPVETGYFALQGSMKQEATIQMLARRAGHRVRFRVLATMYDVRTKLAREILCELRKHFGDKLLPVVVNFNSKLKEAASFGQPITEYDPASRGHQDFEKLAGWLIANPPQPATPDEAQPPAAALPAASNRAAELVERARLLQARTTALAAKLGRDRGVTSGIAAGALPEPAQEFAQSAGFNADSGKRAPQADDAGSVGAEPSIDPQPPAPILGREAESHAAGNGNGNGRRHESGHGNGNARPAFHEPPHAPPAEPTMTPSQALEAVRQAADRAGQTARSILRHEPEPAPQPASEAPSVGGDRPRPGQLREKIARMFGVRPTGQGLLFVQPINGAGRVSIAADFNDWSPLATPMKRDEALGVWQACVPVHPGRYRYRLVIDGEWTHDPFNKYVESNPFGELNNVVEVE